MSVSVIAAQSRARAAACCGDAVARPSPPARGDVRRAGDPRRRPAGLLDDPFDLRVRGAGPDAESPGARATATTTAASGARSRWRPEDLVARWLPAKDGDRRRSRRCARCARSASTCAPRAQDGRAAARTFTRRVAADGVRTRRWRDGLAATLHVPAEPPYRRDGRSSTRPAARRRPRPRCSPRRCWPRAACSRSSSPPAKGARPQPSSRARAASACARSRARARRSVLRGARPARRAARAPLRAASSCRRTSACARCATAPPRRARRPGTPCSNASEPRRGRDGLRRRPDLGAPGGCGATCSATTRPSCTPSPPRSAAARRAFSSEPARAVGRPLRHRRAAPPRWRSAHGAVELDAARGLRADRAQALRELDGVAERDGARARAPRRRRRTPAARSCRGRRGRSAAGRASAGRRRRCRDRGW